MVEMYVVNVSGIDANDNENELTEKILAIKSPFVTLLSDPKINYAMFDPDKKMYLYEKRLAELTVTAKPVSRDEIKTLLKFGAIKVFGPHSERILSDIRAIVGKLAFVDTERNSYYCFLREGFNIEQIEDLDFMTECLDIPNDDRVLSIVEMEYDESIDLGERLPLQY